VTRLSHREACYELRRHARLLETGKLTRPEWYERVVRVLAARATDDPAATRAPQGRSA